MALGFQTNWLLCTSRPVLPVDVVSLYAMWAHTSHIISCSSAGIAAIVYVCVCVC